MFCNQNSIELTLQAGIQFQMPAVQFPDVLKLTENDEMSF